MASFKDAADYVNAVGNTNISVPTSFDVTPDGVVATGATTYNVRELICSLLAGNGILLPNLQLCLKINLGRLIPALPAALAELQDALNQAEAALDEFIEHTGIEAVLDRLNGAIAEFAAIANMINFCGTPIQPRPIPNVLDDMFGAFTGAGQDILDGLGKIADSDIGGCIGTGAGGVSVNFGIFTGGALKDLGDLISDLENGVASNLQERLNSIKTQLNGFASDMRDLVEFENNYANNTVEGNQTGGSVFAPPSRIHKGVGVKIDHEKLDVKTAQKHASNIKHAYQNLKAYKLSDGKTIFDYILEPELIAKLEGNDSLQPLVGERTPILDYCGRETGEYEETIVQQPTSSSTGSVREESPAPGNIGRAEAVVKNVPPTTPVGRKGDTTGDIAYDDNYMYVCIADYDSTSNIWIKSQLASW